MGDSSIGRAGLLEVRFLLSQLKTNQKLKLMKKILSVVDSVPTLRAMAKKGLITLHEQTGKK